MKKTQLVVGLMMFCALMSCQNMENQLNERVGELARQAEFNGAVYLKRGDEVLINQTTRQNEHMPLVGMDSRMNLASLTKLFTELVTLKLAESGKIHLDSTITAYRPTFKPDFGRSITLAQLLNMQSGLPRELNSERILQGVSLDENKLAGAFLDTIPEIELAFEPGTDESYSNLNYWLLGAVIEQVTGKNLEEAYNEILFAPLGMENSGLASQNSGALRGYVKQSNRWQPDENEYSARYASGGFYSSMNDLIRLADALKKQTFLNAESSRFLFKDDGGGAEVYGALPGHTNMFLLDIQEDMSLIVLNNVGVPDLRKITEMKNLVFETLKVGEQKKSSGGGISVRPIEQLSDSIPMEAGMKQWAKAILNGDLDRIYSVIDEFGVEGAFEKDDATWKEIVRARNELANFRIAGYRWVNGDGLEGLQLWCISDTEAKFGLLWIPSESDTNRVANLMVMPVDMTWMGESF